LGKSAGIAHHYKMVSFDYRKLFMGLPKNPPPQKSRNTRRILSSIHGDF